MAYSAEFCEAVAYSLRCVHQEMYTLCSISIENIIVYKIFTLTDVGAAIAPSVVLSHGSNTIKLASVTMMHVNLVDEFMYTAYLQQNSEIHLGHQSHVALGLLGHL